MLAQPNHAISVAEYLAFERDQQDKHEYFEGDIYLQAGASVAHNLICQYHCSAPTTTTRQFVPHLSE